LSALSPSPTVRETGWVIPGVPAVPNSSAYSDQAKAASTPTEISVSMVAAPWRRFFQAAAWNGQAAHTATGAARVSEIHCQDRNWSAGSIAMATTGTDRATLARSRSRSERVGSASAAASVAGRGRVAL
jgi:hypothetical protein